MRHQSHPLWSTLSTLTKYLHHNMVPSNHTSSNRSNSGQQNSTNNMLSNSSNTNSITNSKDNLLSKVTEPA